MFESVVCLNSVFVFCSVYRVVCFMLSRDVYGFVTKLMSRMGCPIEFTE